MKIELDRSEIAVKRATVSHGGEVMVWNVQGFDRSNFDVEFDMFQHVNEFWASMPEVQQQYVFDMYRRIYDVLSTNRERDDQIISLINLIKEFYEFHTLEKMEEWIKLYSDIKWPHWLYSNYDAMIHAESQQSTLVGEYTRKQTYILDDYVKLIVLAFALRMLIPIWGEFIGRTKEDTSTAMKEYRAYQLLSRSSIFTSEAMEKLRTYVDCIVPAEKQKSAIIEGLSSEEFPIWLLSVALIRKVCVSDIRGIFPPPIISSRGKVIDPPTLVTFIFNHVLERIKHSSNNFSGIVTTKEQGNEFKGSGNDQEMSRFESYKINQDLSPGDIVLMCHSCEDPYKIAKFLEPDIPNSLVTQSLKGISTKTFKITDPQFIITQWVLDPYIPARGMFFLDRNLVIQCIAVAESVLWYRKHYLYSMLLSAEVSTAGDGVTMAHSAGDARIPADLTAKLIKYYPHQRKNTASKSRTVRTMNQAFVSIDYVSGLFSKMEWNLTVENWKLMEFFKATHFRKLSMPHDSKIRLAELLLDLCERSEKKLNRYIQKTV